jgi:hyaluronan synthase
MQEVRYYVAFRVNKAAESVFGTVSCSSGCLAAYRRRYVIPILDRWLNQTFLGTPATFGDDRSLTNYMLRRYRVVFDSDALCTTIVPDKHRVFFRQQLRWKKSWTRETLIASSFMWRRHPMAAFCYYVNAIIPVISPIVVMRALFLPLLGPIIPAFSGMSFSTMYLLGCLLMVSLYALYYFARVNSRLWIYGFTSFIYSFFLIWLTYYAFFTVRKNHWGTR